MTRRVAAMAAAIALASASAVAAQPTDGRIVVAAGAAWIGAASMPSVDATETQADGTPRTVFGFSRGLTSTPAIEARVGVRLSPRFDVDAIGSYARPHLRATTAGDVEGAAPVTADEQLQEFTAGGAITWFLVPRDGQTRTRPFVTGGVAYARQLHEAETLAQAGAIVDAGGGVERILSARARGGNAVGVRLDARARVRAKALAVDARTHVSPLVGVSLFVRF